MSPDKPHRHAGLKRDAKSSHSSNADVLSEPLADLDLNAANQYQPIAEVSPSPPQSAVSLQTAKIPIVYTRRELLALSQSPLVEPPPGMPHLKDWFGEWAELQQPSQRKDGDIHTRDRKPKKEADDSEAGPKPSFRSAMASTQPSQMGNFKHQSLRVPTVSDRIDREHSDRDRESNERLRNLSEKYDRERLALSNTTSFRPQRDKDNIPGGRSTHGATSQMAIGKGDKKDRDKDGAMLKSERENSRKKAEVNDDWRKAPRDERRGRQDRSRDSRRDGSHDESGYSNDRDVSWDRAWETEQPEATRRFLDLDDDRQSRDNPSSIRGDESRREPRSRRLQEHKDDRSTRRTNSDINGEDPRSWKDDGRWEERRAVREAKEREKTQARDANTDHTKRNGGRGRRVASMDEDNEPAWMATYDPATDGNLLGILGGNLEEGQLDDIQAWKRDLKEKELRDNAAKVDGDRQIASIDQGTDVAPAPKLNDMDEISMFKMLMQREQVHSEPSTSSTHVISLSDARGLSIPGISPVVADGVHMVGQRQSPLANTSVVEFATQGPGPNGAIHGPPLTATTASGSSVTTNASTSDREYDIPRQSRFLSYTTPQQSNSATNWQGQEVLHGIGLSTHQTTPNGPGRARHDTDMLTSGGAGQNARASPVELSRFTSGASTPGEPHLEPRSSPAFGGTAMVGSESQSSSANSASLRGSRFAKFFDPKPKPVAQMPNYIQNPPPTVPLDQHIPASIQRTPPVDMNRLTAGPGVPLTHDINGLLNMLHNSSRNILPADSVTRNPNQNVLLYGEGGSTSSARDATMPEQGFSSLSRMNPSGVFPHNHDLDSRFSPDGLVPGLRPMRTRDGSNNFGPGFADAQLDQAELLSRGLPQQVPFDQTLLRSSHAGLRPSTPESTRHSIYQSSGGHHGYSSLPGRSVVQHATQASQRLPPGLANLGGRPPHDPTLGLNTSHVSLLNEPLNNHRFPPQAQQLRHQFPTNMNGMGVQSHLNDFGMQLPAARPGGPLLPPGARSSQQHFALQGPSQQQLNHLQQLSQSRHMNSMNLPPHQQQPEYGIVPQEMDGQSDLMSLLLNGQGHNMRPS